MRAPLLPATAYCRPLLRALPPVIHKFPLLRLARGCWFYSKNSIAAHKSWATTRRSLYEALTNHVQAASKRTWEFLPLCQLATLEEELKWIFDKGQPSLEGFATRPHGKQACLEQKCGRARY